MAIQEAETRPRLHHNIHISERANAEDSTSTSYEHTESERQPLTRTRSSRYRILISILQ